MQRVLGVTIVCLLAATYSRADGLKDLNGYWLPSEGQLNGEKAPDDFIKSIKLTLTDGKYSVIVNGDKETGSFTVDTSKKPATMDIQVDIGAQKGKKVLAIYELTGDSLKVCYKFGGDGRPSDFTSTKDNKQFVVTYKRTKK